LHTANTVRNNPKLKTDGGQYLKGKIAEARERLDLHKPPPVLHALISKHLDDVIKLLV
jgi:hypothetical protein